jgi:hypothetical protein
LHSPNSRLRLSIDHLNPTRPAATATAPSTSFPPAASHTQGPPFLFFSYSLGVRIVNICMRSLALPHHPLEQFSRCAPAPKFINQLSRLFLYEICQPLELLLGILPFFYGYVFFISNDEMVFLLSLDRRCIATDDRISALDGTHNKNRATW